MPNNQLTYQTKYTIFDKVIWKSVKLYLGTTSTYLSKRLKVGSSLYAPDLLSINVLMRICISKPTKNAFSKQESNRYETTTRKTQYWHGTGRFQYRNGIKSDVLEELLSQQCLKPSKDIFDPKIGEMHSISLARQRMYARIYADMHEYGGVRKGTRYGSPRFWSYYFIMASILRLVKEFNVWSPKAYKTVRRQYRTDAATKWSIKVTKNPELSAGYFFNKGSDIPGNAAILFGIKAGSFERAETSEGIALYESRISTPVSLTEITHLEVSSACKKEV